LGDAVKSVVGVKFRKQGRIYHFDSNGLKLKKNDTVLVNTENGPAIGVVMKDAIHLVADSLPAELKTVIRKLTDEDKQTETQIRRTESEAYDFCLARITERNLPMKLVEVESLFDGSKVIFYFTADNRVDFRELVKDLVQKYKTRIELRQIGVRNETRIFGGVGICGREICCSVFLHNLDTVSVKMAKEQNMLLNPEKISGICGRLMCCLAYEYENYLRVKKHMPKTGKTIDTPQGRGKVIRQNLLKGTISVILEDGREQEIEIKDKNDEDSKCVL
jgi:cell fate regulator YaaT (PSP1 superfamily)